MQSSTTPNPTAKISLDLDTAETIAHFLRRVTPNGQNEIDWIVYCVEKLEYHIAHAKGQNQ
jgi:hypothetical protein